MGVTVKDTGKLTQAVPYSLVSANPHCLVSYSYSSCILIYTKGKGVIEAIYIISAGMYIIICYLVGIVCAT